MDPKTFELTVAPGSPFAEPGKGILAAFIPPADDERPVVIMANDPRHDSGSPIGEAAAAVVGYIELSMGTEGGASEDVLWACVDNYGRFFEVLTHGEGMDRVAVLERFPAGISVDAFFKAAGTTGEAAIEVLSAVLEAPRATQTLPTEAEFLDAIEAHSNLPSPGVVFHKVDAASQDGDAKTIAAVIQPDPVLSSSLINSANAARFGSGAKTGSVSQAVVRLGTGFVKRIVFVAEMMARYQKGACAEFDYRAYWMNAIANGAAMRGLMEEFEIPARMADEAFTAGLVAGIGWLTIAETYPDLMSKYLVRCLADGVESDPITKARAYREIFPCSMLRVSERYLERFEFPESIREAIVGLNPAYRNWFNCLAKATRVANSLAPFICNTVPTTIPVPDPCREQWNEWQHMLH